MLCLNFFKKKEMNSRFCLNILFHEFVLIRPGKKYIQVNKFLFFCCWGGEKKIGKKIVLHFTQVKAACWHPLCTNVDDFLRFKRTNSFEIEEADRFTLKKNWINSFVFENIESIRHDNSYMDTQVIRERELNDFCLLFIQKIQSGWGGWLVAPALECTRQMNEIEK